MHTHIFRCWANPQEHTGRLPICLIRITLLQTRIIWKKQNENNSCPFCNNLLTSTCQTIGNYPPWYKRHQALPSLKETCVTAGLPHTTLLLWGPVARQRALLPASDLFYSPLNPLNCERPSAESLGTITGQGVKFMLSQSTVSHVFNKNKFSFTKIFFSGNHEQ